MRATSEALHEALPSVECRSPTSTLADDGSTWLAGPTRRSVADASFCPQEPAGAPVRALCALAFPILSTTAPRKGIAQCERAVALDRNVAVAHGYIGMAKSSSGPRTGAPKVEIEEAFATRTTTHFAYFWRALAGIHENLCR